MATLVVATGRAIITNRIKGAGTEPLNMGWGTGVGTTADGDTTLFTEKDVDLAAAGPARTVGASTQQTTTTTNDTYRVVATRTATGGGTVTNLGLFDATTGGNLFFKTDFTGLPIVSGDSIQGTFNTKFA